MHHALHIFRAAIAAVQPQQIIPQYIQWRNGLFINNKPVPLRGRLFLAAAGKAAAAMALETERLIGPHLTAGLAITKHEHGLPLQYCRLIEAGHPLPDAHSVEAAEALQSMLQDLQAEDVVICLLSGGASSLVTDLPDNMDLEQLRKISDRLIRSGADIQEINTVRKHLSRIKGGGLAGIVHPAQLYVIVLSDVVGDRLDVIASGPAAPDISTLADAEHIAHRHGLNNLPLHETPKPGDPVFSDVQHLLAGTNQLALQAAQQKAAALGYHVQIITATATGDTQTLSNELVKSAAAYNGPLPACLLMGGESTVIVKGTGKGGRNQQFALQAGLLLQQSNITILSGGTDGTDGPTDAAGAMVNMEIMEKAAAMGKNAREALSNNDAYTFFNGTEGLIHTGPTQTNVMDIMLALITHS